MIIRTVEAVVLGAVEGLTEFLPVSSTGHLILTAHVLGLHSEAVKTFTVVIQAGAMGAVAWLYRPHLAAVCRGAVGRDPAGRRLGWNLLVSFFPAALVGLWLHEPIKRLLFGVGPVATALVVGGVAMIALDRRSRQPGGRGVDALTAREALLIGLAQCLALWPGMSRAMVTIVGGLLVGLSPVAATEYSFLLALPTLGAATLFDAAIGGDGLMAEAGATAIAAGFAVTGVTAALAMRGFLGYVSRHGLALFGWYRLALAAVVWGLLRP